MKPNPNWGRSLIACAMAAALTKAVFDFPFFKIFCGLMLIYVTHVLLAEKEMKTAAETLWGWIKTLGQVFQGMVIFLILRIFVGSLLGLPPIGSYRALAQGGVSGVISGYNTPVVLLFELAFAVVAGGLTSDYVKGKGKMLVNAVFVISLVVFFFQLRLPKYSATFPSWEEIDEKLATNGGVALLSKAQGTPTAPEAAKPVKTEEVLVLRFEGITPCQTRINFPAQIWGDGPDFWAQFPGVKDPVLYSRGKFTAPDGVTSDADTAFTAKTPEQPAVIRVYERTHRP